MNISKGQNTNIFKKVWLFSLLVTIFINSFIISPNQVNASERVMSITLTTEEQSCLENIGILQVLMDDDFAPVSIYNKDSKRFSGIAVDVLSLLSKNLGFEFKILRDKDLTWADKIRKVKNSEVHILGGISKEKRLEGEGYFTDKTYFQTNYVFIGSIYNHIFLNSINDIRKHKIALVEGASINNSILKVDSDVQVIYFKSQADAFAALKTQKVDLFPCNETVFTKEYLKGRFFDFEIISPIRGNEKRYSFFFPKTEEGRLLSNIFNKGMYFIDINKVIKKHYENKSIFLFYKEHTESLQKINNDKNLLFIWIFLVFIILIFVGLFIKQNIDRKHALKQEHFNRELVKREERYLELVDHIGSGVAVCTPTTDRESFTIRELNKEGMNLNNDIGGDHAIGERIEDFFLGAGILGLPALLQEVASTNKEISTPAMEFKYKNAQGWFTTFIYSLSTGDIVIVFRDVTDLKLSEIRHNKLVAQFQQSQKMEAIGTLAGGIAHDFNNILFPILGYAEMLMAKTPEDSSTHKSVKKIYEGGIRARDLVRQILTFSRQEKTVSIPIKIQIVISEALKFIRSTIPTTIKIEQEIQADCGKVKADSIQIHQIVMNFMTNAFHAMEKTGGTLRVSLQEVELNEYNVVAPDMAPGSYACLTITDTGKGMEQTLTRKIFDPFFTTKEKGKGTGMGLSVVHGIVKSMKGIIQVYSKLGQGTKFHVYLPIVMDCSKDQILSKKESIPTGTEKILLVDDEQDIIEMETRMLTRLGYQVVSCSNGVKALETFLLNPDGFDLIITDMEMPVMSGNRLSDNIFQARPDIPILLCTGSAQTTFKDKLPQSITELLIKPIEMKDLAQKIRNILDTRK